MMKTWIFSLALGLALLSVVVPSMAHADDAHQISAVMKAQFDRPDAPLHVAPVTVEGVYAVAGWTQTGKGGRALLQKDHGKWVIVVCAGDGLTQSSVLQTTGMAASAADNLAKAVVSAEAKLSVDQRRLFGSFEGTIKVDAHAVGHGMHGHAPAH